MKILLSLLAPYLYTFSKAGKTDSDLTCCLQMLLIWHEEENVASEYFMSGMKVNSIFRYTVNTTGIIFSQGTRLVKYYKLSIRLFSLF